MPIVDLSTIQLDEKPDYSNPAVRDEAINRLYGDEPEGNFVDLSTVKMDTPTSQEQKPGITEDVVSSIAYRGIPEGLAASTLGGLGTNIVRGVSDLTRWAAGKAYKGIYGEELPQYSANPVPTSSDILRLASQKMLGKDLYEPQTVPGQFANTIGQFASGGAVTGIPLRNSVISAVGSETAGQATQGTDWEVPARFAGALLAPGGIASNRGSGRQALKTSDDVRADASALYKMAERKGGVLKEDVANKFVKNLETAKPKPIAGKVLTSEDKILTSALDEYAALKNTKLTLEDFERLDKSLGAKVENFVDAKTGKVNATGKVISDLQQKLRRSVETAADRGLVEGGREGVDAYKMATKEWAKQARLSDVERIVSRAEMMDNPVTGIKTGFRTLASNPNKMRGFTETEKNLIRKAAKTGVVTDALRTYGSRLGPIISGSAGLATAGPLGGVAASAGTMATSSLARMAANKIQRGKANRVSEAIINRGQVPEQSALMQLLNSKVAFAERPKIQAPAPTKPLLQLEYKPKATDIVTDQSGTSRNLTQPEQLAVNARRKQYSDLGLTPDVLSVQAQNTKNALIKKYGQSEIGRFVAENSKKPLGDKLFEVPTTEYSQSQVNAMLRNSAWDKLEKAQKSKINAEIEKAWSEQKTPLAEMIMAAEKKAQELAKAKGEKYRKTAVGEALTKVTKDK